MINQFPMNTTEFDEFAEEFLMETSERIIVIICASKLDDILFSNLNKYFLKKISSKDELLEGDQPLSTFSSRIKINYRLGLIDKSFYYLLEQIRAIRNKSAHNVSFNITKPPFKDHIHNIRKGLEGRKSYQLTKQRYFNDEINNSLKELKCLLLSLCVILQAVNLKIIENQINSSSIKTSKN